MDLRGPATSVALPCHSGCAPIARIARKGLDPLTPASRTSDRGPFGQRASVSARRLTSAYRCERSTRRPHERCQYRASRPNASSYARSSWRRSPTERNRETPARAVARPPTRPAAPRRTAPRIETSVDRPLHGEWGGSWTSWPDRGRSARGASALPRSRMEFSDARDALTTAAARAAAATIHRVSARPPPPSSKMPDHILLKSAFASSMRQTLDSWNVLQP